MMLQLPLPLGELSPCGQHWWPEPFALERTLRTCYEPVLLLSYRRYVEVPRSGDGLTPRGAQIVGAAVEAASARRTVAASEDWPSPLDWALNPVLSAGEVTGVPAPAAPAMPELSDVDLEGLQ
jgi:hypothetical protein